MPNTYMSNNGLTTNGTVLVTFCTYSLYFVFEKEILNEDADKVFSEYYQNGHFLDFFKCAEKAYHRNMGKLYWFGDTIEFTEDIEDNHSLVLWNENDEFHTIKNVFTLSQTNTFS